VTFFSQRGEDKKIAELLGTLDGEGVGFGGGFYVDIGAWDPTLDSVTRVFYDAGWSGINVEPITAYYEKLVECRPRDINLNIGISNEIGTFELTEFIDTGLSTFAPAHTEELFAGRFNTRKVSVETCTLSGILVSYAPVVIDFMKIDVEGWERQVIESNDWDHYRPKVLCIEATLPGTNTPAWDTWEPLILAADYEFVHYDDLNRYYRDAR